MVVDVLLDAVKDSVMLLPFVFLIYVLMETLETAQSKAKIEKMLSGPTAPLLGSVTGLVPQCGFSVMCAKLYDNGLIKMGTLLAVFLATSDEGIIILISSGESIWLVLELIAYKVFFATLCGMLVNIFNKREKTRSGKEVGKCTECGEEHESVLDRIIYHPFYHTAKTFIYVLIINIVFGFGIELIGEDNLFAFMNQSAAFQPLFASLIGLVPNCASSIVIAEAYMSGILNFSALVAGLSANAGMGLIVLFKDGKNIKKSIVLAVLLYLSSVILGYIVYLASII